MKVVKHTLMLVLAGAGMTACNNDDDDVYVPPAAYSDHVYIEADSWEYFDEDGVQGYLTEFSVPDLTESINENGAVLVYFDYAGDGIFDALPQVYNDVSILYNTYPGSVEIRMVGINNIEITPPGGEIYCKIVLIEGVALKAHPDLDPRSMTLQQVENTFGVR